MKVCVCDYLILGLSLISTVSSTALKRHSRGHFDQQFASPELQHKIEQKKHDGSSLINLLHKGTLSERHSDVRHFRETENSALLEGVRVHTSSDPPLHVREVGDEHVTTGTFLSMEYINHENYSCTDGFVALSHNDGLLAVHGTILGKCNPHLKTIDTLTLKYDKSFERHWTVYEFYNCTGSRTVYSKSYTPTATCSGDFKYMYQSSELSHELFPNLRDKVFIFPQGEICYSSREQVLSFELHNDTMSEFDSNQCWDMHFYTILVEAVTLTLVQESTLIGQKFESRDDQQCHDTPVKVEGWTLDKCESLGDYLSTKMNWIDIGRQSGNLFVGYSFYNSYDCSGVPELTIHHHYGTPDICAHGAIIFSYSPHSVLSWRDWSFDSHMEDYSSQVCGEGRTYHWSTYNSHCVMKGNERVEFDKCLRFNVYQDMDDDELNTYTSFQAYCHDSSEDNDNVCFHSSSVITYRGKEYSYSALLRGDEPECKVPHSPTSRGVVVDVSCKEEKEGELLEADKQLRVTDTHLVATAGGFQVAYSLKPGDMLFAGLGDSHRCAVVSVRKEESPQTYFGLNCVHSEVLADGLRVSTFGDFHTIPSWYMTYVGGVIGPDVASVVGGFVSDLFFRQ